MSHHSNIEWTDSTWNPVSGCTKITRGCDNCYAERLAERFRSGKNPYFHRGFDLVLHPDHLDRPLRWRDPRMIFVCSISDLFHKEIPSEYLDSIFEVMEKADRHTYQVLTKRSPRMRAYLRRRYNGRNPPGHIWVGVSVEDIDSMARVRHLADTPAAVRFLSCEPLLGPIGTFIVNGSVVPQRDQLERYLDRIDWVIAGGESGPDARPMHPAWAQEIRILCEQAGVPFFFKQWGEWAPVDMLDPRGDYHRWKQCGRPHTDPYCLLTYNGERGTEIGTRGETLLFRYGKKKAGRKLDGFTYDARPRSRKEREAA